MRGKTMQSQKIKKSIVREYVKSFVVALVLALVIKCSVVNIYEMASGLLDRESIS